MNPGFPSSRYKETITLSAEYDCLETPGFATYFEHIVPTLRMAHHLLSDPICAHDHLNLHAQLLVLAKE